MLFSIFLPWNSLIIRWVFLRNKWNFEHCLNIMLALFCWHAFYHFNGINRYISMNWHRQEYGRYNLSYTCYREWHMAHSEPDSFMSMFVTHTKDMHYLSSWYDKCFLGRLPKITFTVWKRFFCFWLDNILKKIKNRDTKPPTQ